MNWPQIFLGCFVLGFVLSALSFAFGVIDLHVHFPWETHVHVGAADAGHMHGLGPINFATITAFVAWFGGAGYLLTTQFRWLTVPALVASVSIGFVGSALVFLLMAKVLWSPDENMQRADYHMVGVLGRVTQPIREGGIGELVYTQGGTRKSCGARSDADEGIDKGTEVVVTAYDHGIATVRRWSDMASEDSATNEPQRFRR
jgi:membrane protein implicated in regulation of membrane protease activity